MQVYKNSFCLIDWDKDHSFLSVKWLNNNIWYRDESEYRKYLEPYVQQIERFHASNVLQDTIDTHYTISVENQAWTQRNVSSFGTSRCKTGFFTDKSRFFDQFVDRTDNE